MIEANNIAQKNGEQWNCLGPIASGGTVFDLAVSPLEDRPGYWAATGCGVFSSNDGGETWSQMLSGLSTPLLSAITIAPNGALFAGALSGELFASFNYGRSWEEGRIPPESQATVTAVAASPNFRQDGTAFAATDGGGLLVSRNSGNSWEDSSFGLGADTVLALAMAPTWPRREIMFAATLEGVFVSRNGGRAWRETDLHPEDDIVDTLAISPGYADDSTVYAGTENGAVYRSTNGGRTWEQLAEQVDEGPVNSLWLPPDHVDSGLVVAAVGTQIHTSSDKGESWEVAAELPAAILSLAGDEKALLAGLYDRGVWKSSDQGKSWESVSEEIAARGFALLVPTEDALYAMGPQEGLWRSDYQEELAWSEVPGLAPYQPLSALAFAADGTCLVAAQSHGILRSQDGDWELVHEAENVAALELAGDSGFGWAGTAEGNILISEDGGLNWEPIDSPCEDQQILAIKASLTFDQDETLFMGSARPETGNRQARVTLWRSQDKGRTWDEMTTQVTNARWVAIAVPLGVDDEEADLVQQTVLATGSYCLRPLKRVKDVWISTKVDPHEANVLDLVVLGEIDRRCDIYAASGNGIYHSGDSGRTWHQASEELEYTSFIALAAHPPTREADLYALSLGGLVWKQAKG